MSKPRKRIRSNKASCQGKKVFETLDAATAAAYRPGRMNQIWGFMTGYKCRACKKYHYGHPTA